MLAETATGGDLKRRLRKEDLKMTQSWENVRSHPSPKQCKSKQKHTSFFFHLPDFENSDYSQGVQGHWGSTLPVLAAGVRRYPHLSAGQVGTGIKSFGDMLNL
jgi:hypothetical protein